jgi:hypothetical protein
LVDRDVPAPCSAVQRDKFVVGSFTLHFAGEAQVERLHCGQDEQDFAGLAK